MKFVISREALVTPLNLVAGVVERRQTMAILANVKLSVSASTLELTGTDTEVELIARIDGLQGDVEPGDITVPARKLIDICKSLPDGSDISFQLDADHLIVRSGRSRFTLSTLPARDFPSLQEEVSGRSITLQQGELRRLIDRTSFAMAQQDVRFYLNGMMWELTEDHFRVVATDGHRLALCTLSSPLAGVEPTQVIVPRKGVTELAKLLTSDSDDVGIVIGSNHVRATTSEFSFTSKLVDGKFPEYQRVLPQGADKTIVGMRQELKEGFSRAAILSNEKYRGVRLRVDQSNLEIVANNPEQEQAEEYVAVEYNGKDPLEIGFNVSYLLDVLNVLDSEQVQMSLAGSNSSALLEEPLGGDALYVVMPMRL